MRRDLLIVGAGGHAKVVCDTLLLSGETVLGFLDIDEARHGDVMLGVPVLGDESLLDHALYANCPLVNGIGGIGIGPPVSLRRSVQERLEAQGRTFIGALHPTAIVSQFAKIHPTAQLLARSVVQAGCKIGPGCIVNTGAIVEHDCQVAAYAQCAPGSVICGDVSIGQNCHIGAGAVVKQGVRLEGATVVGAGAVVVAHHIGRGPLTGTPARDRGTQ